MLAVVQPNVVQPSADLDVTVTDSKGWSLPTTLVQAQELLVSWCRLWWKVRRLWSSGETCLVLVQVFLVMVQCLYVLV